MGRPLNNKAIILVEDLVKIYPGGIKAVDNVSFAVEEGEFFGFLGPNGAGKSTAMKILGTLLGQTSGKATVGGYDVSKSPKEVRRIIGFAMQEVGLDDLATGKDFLVMQGLLYGLSRRESMARTTELLDLVSLSEVAGRKVGAYSGGMRRRIDLAGALVHNPAVLFLDEPTTGLDPQSRLAIWEHLRKLNEQGITIFLTTQIMEEADHLCQRIAIIDRGQIVAEGSPEALKTEVGDDLVVMTLAGNDDVTRRRKGEKAQALLNELSYVDGVNLIDSNLSISVKDGGAAIPDLLRILSNNDITIVDLSLSSPTLDDVFLKHTGRTIRDEDAGGDGSNQAMRQWMGLSRR